MIAGIVAVALCFAYGFLIAKLIVPCEENSLATRLLIASLSVGLGVALFSGLYFLILLTGFSRGRLIAADVLLIICLILFYVVLSRRKRRSATTFEKISQHSTQPPLLQWLRLVFLLELAGCIYASVARCIATPHGDGWDAFAIWNLHARFLFLNDASHWQDALSPTIASWSHTDYPWLLPAAIAHFWSFVGNDSTVVPRVIAMAFTFATVGVLFAGVQLARGSLQAYFAGMCLLGTPFFMEKGLSQYADVPLSFFMLSTIVLISLYEMKWRSNVGVLFLAGGMAGFAAWTKNEGLSFVTVILVVRLIIWVCRRNDPRTLSEESVFLAGMSLPLVMVVFFKLHLAPRSDLVSSPAMMLQKLTELDRYLYMLKAFRKEFIGFGRWFLIPVPLLGLAYLFLAGMGNSTTGRRSAVLIGVSTLLSVAAVYFMVYIVSPYNLPWHVGNSLNRLCSQLYPAEVFIFSLVVRDPGEIWSSKSSLVGEVPTKSR